MMRFWILVVLCVSFVRGSPIASDVDKSTNEVEDLQIDSFAKCSYSEGFAGILSCAATRALKILQQAAKTEAYELFPGVALTSENPQTLREAKSIADPQLPINPKEKIQKLLNLIYDAASRFISGRTLRIKIPEVTSAGIARALEEGRGKRKKGMSPLLLALGVKALLMKALSLLVLGFMSVKALLLSKIAFVLAVILAGQSLFSGGGLNLKNLGGTPYFGGHGWVSGWANGNGHGSPSYGPPNYGGGWTTNSIGGGGGGWGNSQYPYARSIDNVKEPIEATVDAQELAYSQQKP